ncbi:MAG: YaiI/YqxD family protein [Pseudomonadota bacterium]
MTIWVDADACPVVIREIICRAAQRTQTPSTFVANQFIRLPQSPYIKMLQVEPGFDVADNTILQRAVANDIVVTSDIPLAADVLEKGSYVISSRGEQYTQDTIKARLTMRDFMDTMRASGIQSGGPPALSHSDRQQFANLLDRLLTKLRK